MTTRKKLALYTWSPVVYLQWQWQPEAMQSTGIVYLKSSCLLAVAMTTRSYAVNWHCMYTWSPVVFLQWQWQPLEPSRCHTQGHCHLSCKQAGNSIIFDPKIFQGDKFSVYINVYHLETKGRKSRMLRIKLWIIPYIPSEEGRYKGL